MILFINGSTNLLQGSELHPGLTPKPLNCQSNVLLLHHTLQIDTVTAQPIYSQMAVMRFELQALSALFVWLHLLWSIDCFNYQITLDQFNIRTVEFFWHNFWWFFAFFSNIGWNYEKMHYIPYERPESGYSILLCRRAWPLPKDGHTTKNQHKTFFIKIDLLIFRANLLPISSIESISMF